MPGQRRLAHGLAVIGLVCASMLAVASPAAARPVTYLLDPDNSFVHFEVMHFGTSTSRGRFGPLAGSVTMDRAAGRGEVNLRIATAAVNTGLAVFDARLRRPDLLASEAFPEAFFVATGFRFDGDRLAEVRGEFTLRGTSQPLSLKALSFGCRSSEGREICGGDFEGEILRSDFDMTYGLPWVGNRVRLLVQVEGRRQ